MYTWSIPRQLFDIHHTLSIDRPELKKTLLNNEMLSFATKVNFIYFFITYISFEYKKITNEYRLSIQSNQKSYKKFLFELNDLFNDIYGNGTCKIIDTNQHYPFILFDCNFISTIFEFILFLLMLLIVLELNLPDNDYFKTIGINTKEKFVSKMIFFIFFLLKF